MSELNSRQEYLKRYLDGYKSKNKKKKLNSKNSHKQSRIKIVDEDIDIKKIEVSNQDDEFGDEAPLVVDVIDERPDHVKISEIYSRTLWKKLESSVTGEETNAASHPESRDSSEFRKSSNQVIKKEQNIQSKPQERKSSDCVFNDDTDLVQSKRKMYSDKSSKGTNEAVRLNDSDNFSLARGRTSELSHKMEHSASDEESPKRKSNSDDDLSPPRGRTVKLTSSIVLNTSESKNFSRMMRHDSGSDISPPRAKISDMSDNDFSPPRNKADIRNRKQRDVSPSRKNVKHSSESFSASPPKSRIPVQHSSDSDFSPPRETSAFSVNKKYDSDNGARTKRVQPQYSGRSKSSQHSPPLEKLSSKNTKRRYDSDGDSSPSRDRLRNSRERRNSGGSRSPRHKRKSHRREESLPEVHTSGDPDLKKKRPTSTLSGMTAGLQDASTLREETRYFKQREQTAINELSDELSGRNAETISREKDTGRRRNLKEEKLRQKEEEKKNTEKLEKYLEWGKGLKQKDDQEKRLQEDVYEMSKPLARYANDEDLERELKNELRAGDPMLEHVKKRREKNQPVTGLPVYQGPPAPPNRFNIAPGYRWDGVDRSNGFEKKFFEKVNSTKAKEHEAYLWSIENM